MHTCRILFILLSSWQFNAHAVSYFIKDTSCEAISKEIQTNVSVSFDDLDDKQRLKKTLREKALKKYFEQHIATKELYVEEQFTTENKSSDLPSFSRIKDRFHYSITLTPSKNCNRQQAMTEDVFISGKHKQGISQKMTGKKIEGKTIEVTLNMNNKPKFTEFENPIITPNTVFGLQFGSSIKDAFITLGLASLELGNDENKILVYGRNHALHFINEKLVGYQFNESLLPMFLSNELSLANQELKIQINSSPLISLDTPLTHAQLSELNSNFNQVNTAYYKTDIGKNERRLIGISQGKLIPKINTIDNCFAGTPLIGEYLKNNHKKITLKLVSEAHENIIITHCNELIYAKNGDIEKIKLIEAFSSKNIALEALANYFKQSQTWAFSGVKYNDPVERLSSIGDYYEFLDTVEFTSPAWEGYFYLYEGKLLNAELISNTH
jgi:hypothetical protein